MAISALFLLSFSGAGQIDQNMVSFNALAILADEGFTSQPIFYGNAESSNYPASTLRHIRILFDERSNTLHIVGWYYRTLEEVETKQLLHFILEPGKDLSLVTVSESGDPSPPLHLFLNKEDGIRLIWNAGTTSYSGYQTKSLYQYIWRQNGNVSFASLPPLPFVPNLSRIVQDASGAIHVITFQKIPIDEDSNFFQLHHIYETTTEWKEERFSLAVVSDLFQSVCYDATITVNGTLAAILHNGELVSGITWVDTLTFLQVSNGNASMLTQNAPSDAQIHNIRLLSLPDNSLIAIANIDNRLAAGRFDSAGLLIDPIELPGADPYATEFDCKVDTNGKVVIAYVAHEDRYSERGILSILQEKENDEWQHAIINSEHYIWSKWELREGWVLGWYGREGWGNFALDTSNSSPILAFASIPTATEIKELKYEQKRVTSLYIAQTANSSMHSGFGAKLIGLDQRKENSFLSTSDWPVLLVISCAIVGFGLILEAARRLTKSSQKSTIDSSRKE